MGWAYAGAAAVLVLVIESRLRHVPAWLVLWLAIGGLTQAALQGGAAAVLDRVAAMALLALPGAQLLRMLSGDAGRPLLIAALGSYLGWRQGLFALAGLGVAEVALVVFAAKLQLARAVALPLPAAVIRSAAHSLRKTAAEVDNSNRAQALPVGLAILVGLCVALAMSLAAPGLGFGLV
ncbi:MAG: hypothetical protein U1E76_10525 [Planctomycetota bacterium]